ncbi:MAG: 23S rRNA (pseudouridine(1915)-N(3))-methyltransferase RlmH [Bacilli bacterium]
MIKIICVGKLKEKYWQQATDEYLKRLSKYNKIELIEVSDSKIDNLAIALKQEKDLILNKISSRDYLVALAIEGEMLTSKELATKIEKLNIHESNLCFIIGGSNGIHEDILKRCSLKLSFSKLTFPHQMFRVMFLEQLYRAYKINNNESYHK